MKNKTIINLISGFLGVGKTTLLKSLIKQKPENEKWALIINEFGDIGIDGAIFTNEDLPLIEVSGGCLCCLAGPQMMVSVVNLLRKEKPDRLIIEASGLAHAANIIDELNKKPLKESLDIGVVLTVVDIRQFVDNNYFRQPLYRDQVSIADVLIGTKSDLADVDMVEEFYNKAEQLFPPKNLIINAINGNISLDCLKTKIINKGDYRLKIKSLDIKKYCSYGFLWEANKQFNVEKISKFFNELPELIKGLVRAKGVFCIENNWVLLNWVDGVWGANEVSWRRDNRFELISEQYIDKNLLELELINCFQGDVF